MLVKRCTEPLICPAVSASLYSSGYAHTTVGSRVPCL